MVPAPAQDYPDRDQDLVERIRAGDATAFEALFTAYYSALYKFVRSYIRAPDVAEELLQNVFFRVWEQRAEWRPSEVRAYLYGACRNRALSYLRHERTVERFEERAVREQLITAAGRAPAQPDEQVQAHELGEALRHAIHELPERRRLVVILRWEHDLSYAEIGQILGITVKSVETQHGRAMAVLRRRLAAFRR